MAKSICRTGIIDSCTSNRIVVLTGSTYNHIISTVCVVYIYRITEVVISLPVCSYQLLCLTPKGATTSKHVRRSGLKYQISSANIISLTRRTYSHIIARHSYRIPEMVVCLPVCSYYLLLKSPYATALVKNIGCSGIGDAIASGIIIVLVRSAHNRIIAVDIYRVAKGIVCHAATGSATNKFSHLGNRLPIGLSGEEEH